MPLKQLDEWVALALALPFLASARDLRALPDIV
jgi:hypothetical protein